MIAHRRGDGRRRLYAHHLHQVAHPLLGNKLGQSPTIRAISNHRKRHRETAGPAGCENHGQSQDALMPVDQSADEEQSQRQLPGTAGLPFGRRGQFDAVVDADHSLGGKAGGSAFADLGTDAHRTVPGPHVYLGQIVEIPPVAMEHIRNRDVIAQQMACTLGQSIQSAGVDKHHVETLAVPGGRHQPGPVNEAVVGIERRAVGGDAQACQLGPPFTLPFGPDGDVVPGGDQMPAEVHHELLPAAW